jgi:hypothetical protein
MLMMVPHLGTRQGLSNMALLMLSLTEIKSIFLRYFVSGDCALTGTELDSSHESH